ncbi:unnamed protein product [Schistosoma turkestanicum]|nr:unnamed protein product [Schistosoma turkestanicum]
MKFKLIEQRFKIVNLFIILNCFFAISGFVLFVLSVKAQYNLFQYKIIINYTTPIIFPAVIFTGSVSLLAASLGFIGLWKKINIFFILHLACLTMITLIDASVAIASLVNADHFLEKVEISLNNALQYYYSRDEYGDEFDRLHTNFYCCGVNSYADFRKLRVVIPFSCRIDQFVYAQGCYDELSEFVQHYITLFISMCFVTSVVYALFIAISIIKLRQSIQTINTSSENNE